MNTVVTPTRLWLGVLLAPGAWLVAEFVGYYLASRACDPGLHGVPLAGFFGAPRTAQVIFSGLMLVAALAGLWIAAGNTRALRDHEEDEEPTRMGRAKFMSFGGVLLSVLFAGGIALFAIAAPFVNACSQAR